MKKAQKPAAKVSPTVNQIARGECCNASKELKAIINQTGLAPAEIAHHLKRIRKPSFLRWLAAMPTIDETGSFTTSVELSLYKEEWTQLAEIANRNKWTIEDALERILANALNGWRPEKERNI